MNGVYWEKKLATVNCVVHGGVFPIGGSVNGIDQMNEHGNDANYVPPGAMVDIVRRSRASVVSYGGFHAGETVEVVAIEGRGGFYIASSFV